jgi:hypothetical protein
MKERERGIARKINREEAKEILKMAFWIEFEREGYSTC